VQALPLIAASGVAHKEQTFSFSNQMLRRYYRVSPQTKRRALEELEAAGQISIERQRGRAPIITLIGF